MNPSQFAYQRAGTVEEAIALMQEHGDGAKLIAGGHSLLPIMKLRLAEPEMLVDIGRIPELRGVERADGEIAVGALTTHHQIATRVDPRFRCSRTRRRVLVTARFAIGEPSAARWRTPMQPRTIRRRFWHSMRPSSPEDLGVNGPFRRGSSFSIS
jgi:CO/xanthine dehydrogenase FAD-binding subunit